MLPVKGKGIIHQGSAVNSDSKPRTQHADTSCISTDLGCEALQGPKPYISPERACTGFPKRSQDPSRTGLFSLKQPSFLGV